MSQPVGTVAKKKLPERTRGGNLARKSSFG